MNTVPKIILHHYSRVLSYSYNAAKTFSISLKKALHSTSGTYIIFFFRTSDLLLTFPPCWLTLESDVRIEPSCISSLMSLSIRRQTAKTAFCLSPRALCKWLVLLFLERCMCWHFIVAKKRIIVISPTDFLQ